MSKTIVDLPIRACPFPECQCIWVEDSQMYEEPDRCPACGRYGEDYELAEGEELEGGTGTGRRHFAIYTQTAGPLMQQSGEFLITSQKYPDTQFR